MFILCKKLSHCGLLVHTSKLQLSHLKPGAKSLLVVCADTQASSLTSPRLAPLRESYLLPPFTAACSDFIALISRTLDRNQHLPVEEVRCVRCGTCRVVVLCIAWFVLRGVPVELVRMKSGGCDQKSCCVSLASLLCSFSSS